MDLNDAMDVSKYLGKEFSDQLLRYDLANYLDSLDIKVGEKIDKKKRNFASDQYFKDMIKYLVI